MSKISYKSMINNKSLKDFLGDYDLEQYDDDEE